MTTQFTTLKQTLNTPELSKEQLLNAGMSELSHQARSSAGKALTDGLLELTLAHEKLHHPRKQAWREADLKAFRSGVAAFAADLLIHSGNVESGGAMYRSSSRALFSGTHCSSRHFERLSTFWAELGWIKIYPGFRKYGDFLGDSAVEMAKARRIRALRAFLNIAEDYGIVPENARKHFSKDHAKSLPVEVKSRSKRDSHGKKHSIKLKAPESDALDIALCEMRELNQFLELHSFSLPEAPQFKRTFHNGDDHGFDYNMGGRLYCVSAQSNYQNMPKAERLTTIIDGEPSAEVDVSNSFLAIFHSLCKQPFDPSIDLYTIDGIERDVVKKIVVARLASDDWPSQWPKGMKAEYLKATGARLERVYKLKNVIAEVKRSIPILSRIDQSKNGWAQLQYWESEAILGAMLDLKNNYNAVALPIHDSLLVAGSSVDLAVDALTNSYQSLFGFSPRIKVRS